MILPTPKHPMTAMGDPGAELVYAIARVHWNVGEESGTVVTSAQFGGGEREGWSWLEIYIDQEVLAGDTSTPVRSPSQ